MNPTGQGGNPYLQVLSQMQGNQGGFAGSPVGATGNGGGMPTSASKPNVGVAVPGGIPPPTGGQLGGTPGMAGGQGTTKILISALQALQQFTQVAGDPQEQAIVRSIITLLSGLIQRDMSRADQGGTQQPGGTTTPQGAGTGMGGGLPLR